MSSIPVIDLHAQYIALKTAIDTATQGVLASGWYILGKEVTAFEEEFAAYLTSDDGRTQWAPATDDGPSSAISCVGVNSGTDALQLALRACAVGVGDEVITVSHTAVATVAAIRLTGATPVLVDIDPATYTMSPTALAAAITPQTKAIIPVHLYGQPAAMGEIMALAQRAGVPVIEDCAQAHGARYQGQPVGTLGDLGCFSFYPTKNLGALGDGGAVVGRNPELIAKVRSLREYGWTPQARYISQAEGVNSRLDEMQAAILRAKLPYLDEWNTQRASWPPYTPKICPQRSVSRSSNLIATMFIISMWCACRTVMAYVKNWPRRGWPRPSTTRRPSISSRPISRATLSAMRCPTPSRRCVRFSPLPLYPQLSTDQAHQVVTRPPCRPRPVEPTIACPCHATQTALLRPHRFDLYRLTAFAGDCALCACLYPARLCATHRDAHPQGRFGADCTRRSGIVAVGALWK